MYSNAKEIIMRVVDRFAHTGEATDDEVKVVCLPDNKTSVVEPNDSGGVEDWALQVDPTMKRY